MEFWYKRIAEDLSELPDFIEYYEKEYLLARPELSLKGRIEQTSGRLPVIIEHRFSQLQDIEAVLELLNIQIRKTRGIVFKQYYENVKSARALTAKECDRYVDANDDVNTYAMLINQVALLRNQYLGILKGLDNKSYQLNNISKLKAAGLDDALIDID